MPKRGTLKYKKYHKSSINKISAIRLQCCPDIAITEVILKEPVRMTMKHVNAIRKTIRRLVKKQGRLHRVITSFWPITAKPIQIRMGKGKGAVSYWAGRVSSGTVVSSFKKITLKLAQKSLRAGSTKVPGRTKVLINNLLRWGRNNEL